MIQIKFIPDGGMVIPPEARDHGALRDAIQDADLDTDSAPDARDIERVVSGTYTHVKLRIRDGMLDDFSDEALDSLVTEIESIEGIKAHSDGWTETE